MTSPRTTATDPRGPWRDALRLWVPLALMGVAAIWLLYEGLVDDPPTTKLVLSTGGAKGQYYAYGQRYAKWMKENFQIDVEVRTSLGTGENVERLLDPDSDVSAALVQGGVPIPGDDPPLLSLGSLYREPLWVFYRGETRLSLVSELLGKRIGVGSRASGTFPIARSVLAANGIEIPEDTGPDGTATDARTGTAFHFLGGAETSEALRTGTLDAAFLVVGVDAPYLRDLLATPEVRILSIGQWESYTRRFPFLSHVVLPRGLIDLGRDIPGEDVHLIAPTATLVVREDLHPALASVLVQAAYYVHRSGDVLSAPNEFPSVRYVDLPVSLDAESFYQTGPPLLQRWVGFHWAIWVDRLKVMILPLVMLVLPLFRAAPPLMRWRIRARIYRWYAVIREADVALKSRVGEEVLRMHFEKLKRIGVEVTDVRVPLSYMHEFYGMRFHLALVQERLAAELSEPMGTVRRPLTSPRIADR